MNNTVLDILLQNLNLDENVLTSLHTVINESLEEKEVDNLILLLYGKYELPKLPSVKMVVASHVSFEAKLTNIRKLSRTATYSYTVDKVAVYVETPEQAENLSKRDFSKSSDYNVRNTTKDFGAKTEPVEGWVEVVLPCRPERREITYKFSELVGED